MGACTRSGKLCVIIEYCPHGSLLNFLRARREIFEPVWFKNETDMENEFTYIDLAMVAFQVARGMDFLASKKVRRYLVLLPNGSKLVVFTFDFVTIPKEWLVSKSFGNCFLHLLPST